MGPSLSGLHRERVETSEMISTFLCLNLCILILRQWKAPGYVFYTLRIQPPELEFESSELRLSHLGIGSIEMQVPRPTPLNYESGGLPAFLSQVPLPLGLAQAPDPNILHLDSLQGAIHQQVLLAPHPPAHARLIHSPPPRPPPGPFHYRCLTKE